MKIKATAESTGQEIVLSSYDVLSVMSQLALEVHKLQAENDKVNYQNRHKDDEVKIKIPYPEICDDKLTTEEMRGNPNNVNTRMKGNYALWHFQGIRNYLNSNKSKNLEK